MFHLRTAGFSCAAALVLVSLAVSCSDDAAPGAAGGGAAAGGEGGAVTGVAGHLSNGNQAGADDSVTANGGAGGVATNSDGDGGADTSNVGGSVDGGAGAPGTDVVVDPTSGPCRYSATADETFPTGKVLYICTNNSRIFQAKGQGDYTVLLGAGFAMDSGESSTVSCSVSSSSAPAAGDTWVMSAGEHPGGCDLSFMAGATSLWSATSTPTVGSVSVTFKSVTLTHGTTKPEDVYYLGEVTFSATLKGMSGSTTDAKLTGTYQIKMTPLGA